MRSIILSGVERSLVSSEVNANRESVLVEERSVNISSRGNPAVLLSRTTANQNTRNALRGLVENDMLAEFWTMFSWDPESKWNGLLPRAMRTQLARRTISEAPAHLVRSVPWREMVRQGVRGTPLETLLCSGQRPFSVFGMDVHFDASVARRLRVIRPNMVYANEGSALETFREAKRQGITTILEQSSAYWNWLRNLLMEEAEQNPEFSGLVHNLKAPDDFLERKESELRLADYVFVPSQHILRTLKGVRTEDRVFVVPYGAPEVKPRMRFNLDPGHPLQVLFVGNLGQNKGIGYLLEAVEMLGAQVQLTMVGRRVGSNSKVDEACRRWRWHETLPHSQVLDVMQQADVLVLPSLCDAFGLVVTEALACGLPVIVTPNTGASEIVRDAKDGFIVPIRHAEVIASRLEILFRNRELLVQMSKQAQQTAAENSWTNYRAAWVKAVRSLPWQ